MIRKKIFKPLVVLAFLLLALLACGGAAQVAQKSDRETVKYSVQDLYNLAMQVSEGIVRDRSAQMGWLVAISILVGVIAASRWLGFKNLVLGCSSVALAFMFAFGGFFVGRGDVSQKVDTIGHELANSAITQGVDQARKAQATELQYIHAVVVQFGADTQQCERTVNYHDFCSSNSSYYTHREINSHQVCTESTDSDGKTTESCHEEHDDEYTPWFTFLTRYWIVPDTKAKYLHPSVYSMEFSDPNAHPKVFLHGDWRAPEDAANNVYRGERPGQYNNHVPEFWARVRQAGKIGGLVIDATFVGPYFHWGLGSEDVKYLVYDGHYRDLQKLVKLPGPTGVAFNYTDAFGQPASMNTLLTSKDSDLALDFQPLTVIGCSLNENVQELLTKRALEFQGHFGPNKEASAREFLVTDSVVNSLGGIENATSAIKAYLNDFNVWGHFRLAKNLVVLITKVSDDCNRITGRDMTEGMPMGNVLVEQRMRLSIDGPIPLTSETWLGSFTGGYAATEANELTYKYSDMSVAGAVIGLLYEQTPGWTPPDPNSDACSTAPAEHLGFVRYQMCTQQYLESTIKVNGDGALLILDGVRSSAAAKTPVWPGWVLLMFALIFAGVTGYVEVNNGHF